MGLIFLCDPANTLTAIDYVEMAVIGLKELHRSSNLFSLGFSAFSLVFFLFHMKLSLEKEGKQNEVRWQYVSSEHSGTGFNWVHHSSPTNADFAPVCIPRMISLYHPLSGE